MYRDTVLMNFLRHLNSPERVGTVQNTIPDELERYGLFKHVSRSMMIKARNIIMKPWSRN